MLFIKKMLSFILLLLSGTFKGNKSQNYQHGYDNNNKDPNVPSWKIFITAVSFIEGFEVVVILGKDTVISYLKALFIRLLIRTKSTHL